MEPISYLVSKIDGDYAVLLREGTSDTILVARALLPEETDAEIEYSKSRNCTKSSCLCFAARFSRYFGIVKQNSSVSTRLTAKLS